MGNAKQLLKGLQDKNNEKRQLLEDKYLSRAGLSQAQIKTIKKFMLIPAGDKISQLPAANTPLLGTELLAIVQAGSTDQCTVNDVAIATMETLGYRTIGVGGPAAGYYYSSIHQAISSTHSNFYIATDLTETVASDFAGLKNFIVASGVTLNFNNARQFVAQAGMNASIILNGLGGNFINYYQTLSVPFIDLTGAIASPPSGIIGDFLVFNGSSDLIAAPFIDSNLSSGTGLFYISGSLVYFPNGNQGSACDMDQVNIDSFITVFQTALQCGSLKTKGGTIGNLLAGNDTHAASVVFDLTDTTVSNFKTQAETTAGIFNFRNSPILSRNYTGAIPVVNIITGNARASLPFNIPQIREVDTVPLGAPSTGSFVDFQTFTVPAQLIIDQQSILYKSIGEYTNQVEINCVFGSDVVFNAVLAAPVSGPQAYQLEFELTRISDTQANASIFLKGGKGVDNFEYVDSGIVSLIDWAIDNVFKTQGQCNVAINTISSTQAKFITE